ncbi:MAG: carboxypeptidase-like regulatory domain-containing protein [Gemmatimonadetes bacterium]|nr:carboxypeptidase-like regulatory domain-containing protein [Gemmatimonadota bacterium]
MTTRAPTIALLLALALGLAPTRLSAQESSVISGRVLGAGTEEPLANVILRVGGTDVSAVSDREGRFVLRGVPVGSHELQVRQGQGEHTVALAVSRPDERFEVVIHLGSEGMSVEIVGATPAPASAQPPRTDPATGVTRTLPTVTVREDVTVAPPPAPALRAGSLVDKAEILRLAGSSRNLSDLLRRAVPALYVRPVTSASGDLLCLEFRGAQARSIIQSQLAGTCNHPQVYLDGVPLIDPAPAYGITNYDAVEWIQAIPPAEAGPQFGGAPYGVIIVTTAAGRRTAAVGMGDASLLVRSRHTTFDWEQDPAGHPFWRALAASALGSTVGLVAGRSVWRHCVYVDDVTRELERTCPRPEVAARGAVAVALPALGSALGAHRGGRTGATQGRWIPALAGATLALLPGYGFSLATVGNGVEATNTTGRVFLVAGTPLFTVLADRLYRRQR